MVGRGNKLMCGDGGGGGGRGSVKDMRRVGLESPDLGLESRT